MARTIWFISDTHFGHENIIGYCSRPFTCAAEMDEVIVERWNRVVRPQDHVYHMGDVAMKAPQLAIVGRLNGHKRLIRGNHDIFDTRKYLYAGFDEIHGCRVLGNVLFTHFPVHPESLGRFLGNAHGHIHERPSPAGAYVNLSVERIDYTPVTLETVIAMLGTRMEAGCVTC
jgi:calcineurin-like phosphoesterase family protein